MALVCSRCNKQVGMMGRLTYDSKYGRCGDCNNTIKRNMEQWRRQFLAYCQDGLLSESEWLQMEAARVAGEFTLEEGLSVIRRDAINFLERTFTFAKADGDIDEQEEYQIGWLAHILGLKSSVPHIGTELNYLIAVRKARNGQLTPIKPTAVLPVDEIAYLEMPVSYEKVGRSGDATLVPGKLLLTNKRIIFTAPSGGGEVLLKKVTNVNRYTNGVVLELAQAKLNGFYKVESSQLVAETILAVVRMSTRQLVGGGTRDTRRIPQEIKMQVWQRDAGKCVQCGASEYLEFDHVIPHSKGGATSTNNLQLLCRKCNLAKGSNL